MKSIFHPILILLLAAVSFSASQANEYREDVLAIARSFESDDPETQYEARRSLEILVSEASAPGVMRGKAKIASDLLYALASERTPREAKKYLLRQIARVGSSKTVAPLVEIMKGDDVLLAENARKALEATPGNKARSALIKAYSTQDERGRLDILRSLAHRGEEASVPFLAEQLESGSDEAAAVSAWALGRIGGSRSLAVLSVANTANRSGEVTQAIERALLTNDGLSNGALRELYRGGGSVATKRAALRLLIHRQADETAEAISSGIASDNRDMRLIAIESALSSKALVYQDIVLDRVGQMDAEDLFAVLAGLRNVDRETAEGIALDVFESSEEDLQLIAVELLGHIGSARSVGALLRAFDEGSRALQIKASLAIARIDTPAMDEWILATLHSNVKDDNLLGQEILVHRNVSGGKERLLHFVQGDDDALARGALRTFSVIANTDDLDRLFEISRGAGAERKRLIESLLKKLGPEFGSIALQRKLENLGIVE